MFSDLMNGSGDDQVVVSVVVAGHLTDSGPKKHLPSNKTILLNVPLFY